MADTKVSKTFGDYTPWGFDSPSRHLLIFCLFLNRVMKYFITLCLFVCFAFIIVHSVWAQTITPSPLAISPATASQSAAQNKKQLRQVLLSINEISNPEQEKQKNEIL